MDDTTLPQAACILTELSCAIKSFGEVQPARCSGPQLVVERGRENLHMNGIFHSTDYFCSVQIWMLVLTIVLQRFPRCRYNGGNDGGRLESR